jgi:hypothetical protein
MPGERPVLDFEPRRTPQMIGRDDVLYVELGLEFTKYRTQGGKWSSG